jgi:hypothetical protein
MTETVKGFRWEQPDRQTSLGILSSTRVTVKRLLDIHPNFLRFPAWQECANKKNKRWARRLLACLWGALQTGTGYNRQGSLLPQTSDSFHSSISPMNSQKNFRPFSARRLRCPDPWSQISLVLAVSESTQACDVNRMEA